MYKTGFFKRLLIDTVSMKRLYDLIHSTDDNSEEILSFIEQKEAELTYEEVFDMVMQTCEHHSNETHDDRLRLVRCSTFQLSIHRNKSSEVLFKLMDIGGRGLLMKRCEGRKSYRHRETALITICRKGNISMDIISEMIRIGERELIMMADHYGCTALHSVCENQHISLESFYGSKLFMAGGSSNGFICGGTLRKMCPKLAFHINLRSQSPH